VYDVWKNRSFNASMCTLVSQVALHNVLRNDTVLTCGFNFSCKYSCRSEIVANFILAFYVTVSIVSVVNCFDNCCMNHIAHCFDV